MVRVEKMKAWHLFMIKKTRVSEYLNRSLTEEKAKEVENGPYAFTFFDDKNQIVMCGGVIEVYPGRGEAWAIFAKGSLPQVRYIVPIVKGWLRSIPVRRIEAAAIVHFKAAHRLLRKIGFELEAERLKAFSPEGHDCSMYAIVKGDR